MELPLVYDFFNDSRDIFNFIKQHEGKGGKDYMFIAVFNPAVENVDMTAEIVQGVRIMCGSGEE